MKKILAILVTATAFGCNDDTPPREVASQETLDAFGTLMKRVESQYGGYEYEDGKSKKRFLSFLEQLRSQARWGVPVKDALDTLKQDSFYSKYFEEWVTFLQEQHFYYEEQLAYVTRERLEASGKYTYTEYQREYEILTKRIEELQAIVELIECLIEGLSGSPV